MTYHSQFLAGKFLDPYYQTAYKAKITAKYSHLDGCLILEFVIKQMQNIFLGDYEVFNLEAFKKNKLKFCQIMFTFPPIPVKNSLRL